MDITVLGIGRMGLPMARRLCQAGHRVRVWNRNPAKAEPLAADGARVCASLAEAVDGAELVISLLEDGPAVASVLFEQGAAAAMRAGQLFVDMASIAPREARAHAQRLATQGVEQLDAPVSGGTVGAEAGTLAIMAGGLAEDFARAAPAFAALGRATHVGPHGAGQLAKLANQMIVGITIGAVAEALLEYETLTGDEIRKVIAGEKLGGDEDAGTPPAPSGGGTASVVSIPKTRKPRATKPKPDPEPSPL